MRSVRDPCAIDWYWRVSSGHLRITDLAIYLDFRRTTLAAELADLHSGRWSLHGYATRTR